MLAIEGPIFAAFPGAAKRLRANALETPDASLRVGGVASAVLGVLIVWLVRAWRSDCAFVVADSQPSARASGSRDAVVPIRPNPGPRSGVGSRLEP